MKMVIHSLSRLGLLFLLLAPLPVFAQNPPQEKTTPLTAAQFKVSQAKSQIKIDGELNEPAWATATVIPLPFEWTPGDNTPAPVQTECLVTYDLHNLYIAFRCHDPEPAKIRAHLMDRDDTDSLVRDDHVSFMVDAFNDERRGFQFRVNPLGVQADAIFSELEGYEDFSWDAIWDAAGQISESGYTVETAIPLNQLRFKKTDQEQTWGFTAERSWPRDARHRFTSHKRQRQVACIICQFNKLTGFQGITPSRNIELNPTLTANRTDAMDLDQFPYGDLEAGKIKFEPGITAKWGITSNLILNAAINPDFSQIEADVAQLEVNRRFAIYYPEKRPFFLEGADFFLTPIQAVFTRTVFNPLWGAKFTGKSGRTAIGFFSSQDEVNNLLFPFNEGSMQGSLEDEVYSGVFRLRQDVGKNSTVGLLYTGRAGSGYSNQVAGADGFLRFDQSNSLTFQFIHSETRYPDEISRAYGQKEGHFGGNALHVDYMHQSRRWILQAAYDDFGRNFRADSGFVPRVDLRSVTGLVFHRIWGQPKSWFNQIRLGLLGQAGYNQEGKLTDQGFTVGLMYAGLLETAINIHGNAEKVFFNGRYFDMVYADWQASLRPFGGSEFGLQGRAGDQTDYENAREASLFSVSPYVALNIGRHAAISLSHQFELLYCGDDRIYSANLLQAKLIYNFSVRSFIRGIVQYRDISRNPGMYLEPQPSRSKGLFTQFLFSYKVNPRTVLFLGYSDNGAGLEGVDITRINRTFFLKISYAWQI